MNNNIITNNPFTLENVEFYSFDGSDNNLENRDWGSVDSPLLETVEVDYGDGIASPTGANRPNPRVISNAVASQTENTPSEDGLTNIIWAFGQFLDHDLDLVLDSNISTIIPVPTGDPDLDPMGTGSVIIPMHESIFIEGTGTDINNPRQLPNKITSWLDGSNIYGSDEERADFLRTGDSGTLKVSEGNLLPFNDGTQENDDPRGGDPTRLFLAGDIRANENSVLVSMHTLFVREHNRLAGLLTETHSDWTDEEIYQRARQINIAQYQNIIYNEYLPALLGDDAITEYQGYDPLENPNIARVFANSAFRFGHSQLSSDILRLDNQGQEIPEGSLTLADVFFQPVGVVQETGIDPILRGITSSLSQSVDSKIIDDVRNLLFGFGANAIGRDLSAINIERARLNGVADYNSVREAYDLEPVSSFAEITNDIELQSRLESLYGSVDNIDTTVGILSENHVDGAAVGETVQKVLAKQFTSLRDGDRFYYENTFSTEEIADIESITLSDIILLNTDTEIIQDNAFSLINEGSDLNETLSGGLGRDTIYGRDGDDRIFGNRDRDFLSGNRGDDRLMGGNGSDILDGGQGDDYLRGNDGNDYLHGNSGSDKLYGDKGNDKLIGGSGKDTLMGGNGQDILKGNKDNDLLNGHNGSDTLYGNDGNDTIFGGNGGDELRGDLGNDVLTGGNGKDIMIGGQGKDLFSLRENSGCDRIVDYQDGTDKFLLKNDLQFEDLRFVGTGNNSQIVVRETNDLLAIVNNINPDRLNVDDFVIE